MLTDSQIRELSVKMNVPLADVCFKTDIPSKFEFNKSYVINLDDEYDEGGNLKSGSHWVCLQINKYPNDNIQSIYFDSYGQPPPEIIKKVFKKTTKKEHLPFNTKDIQSLMSDACGWYCMAFLHFINNFSERTRDLYSDTDHFLEFFDDLNKSVDFKKNEFILKLFFQPDDKSKRKSIEVISDPDRIDTKEGIDAFDGISY